MTHCCPGRSATPDTVNEPLLPLHLSLVSELEKPQQVRWLFITPTDLNLGIDGVQLLPLRLELGDCIQVGGT